MTETERAIIEAAESMRGLTEYTRFQSEAAAAAAAESKNLAREEKAASEASARFKAKMDAASGAVGAVADVFVTYNKSVYKGASANEAAAQSMEKMGEAAKYAGAFLAILVPGGPLVKALVAGLALAAAKTAEFGAEIARHTDSVFNAYQEMAKIGATGAGGMQDVFDGLQKVGLGTEKFGEYLKLVNSNANDLAMFGGTVRSGRKEFEKTMGSLTTSQREELQLMVGGREAQAEATMTYIKQQRLLTMGTKSQMDTSSAAVMRYIKETDELTRITGANREEQQKILDKAMSEEIFASYLDSLEDQGEAGKALAKQHRANNLILEKTMGPEFARGMRDSITGFIGSSNAASKAFMGSGGASAEYASNMAAFGGDANEARKQLDLLISGVATNYKQLQQGIAQMGVSEDVFGRVSENRRAIAVQQLGIEKSLLKADEERKAALADDPTRKMAEAENKAREQQLFVQKQLNLLMPGYIEGLTTGQQANQYLTDKIMDSVIPALQELYQELEPLLIQLRDFVAEDVLPALTESIRYLAKFIKDILPSAEIRATEKTVDKANEGKSFWSQVGFGADRGGRADADQTAANKALEEAYEKERAENRKQTIGFLKELALWGTDSQIENRKQISGFLKGLFGMGGGNAQSSKTETEVPISERDKTWLAQQKEGVTPMPGTPIQGKAVGGPVSAKTPYLVGEEGPELFVPSMAGDIIPTDKLQGTSGAALKQSDAIEKIVDQIVLDIKTRQKISDIDADRAKDHSAEQKTQTEKINKSINDIVVSSKELDSITKIDLKRAQDYSIFYKGFIETKTKFEKDQLEAINYQLTEGSSGGQQGGGSGSGLKLPSMPGIAGMGGGQGLQTTKQDDLSKMGLNIKTGDVQAEGAGISPRLIELARQIQGGVPGFGYFSAFNDKFHQEKAPGSQHAKGLALDFTVAQQPSVEEGKAITDWLKGLGASLAIDEYNNPSSKSTAGHFHAQIPGFEDGGMLGAGKIGIAGEGGKPELISGPASITPMNDLMGALNSLNATMERSHATLSEIARVSKATSDSSAKMLSYAQN
jgi:hypothetical protein